MSLKSLIFSSAKSNLLLVSSSLFFPLRNYSFPVKKLELSAFKMYFSSLNFENRRKIYVLDILMFFSVNSFTCVSSGLVLFD